MSYQFHALFLAVNIKHEDGPGKELQRRFGLKNVIALAAMRPEFQLGSLYDRRTDNPLLGFTLWKEESYKKKAFLSERLASNKQWLTDSENTFSSKVLKLDIEAGLTLSLLGGLIDVKGHAEYLKDTASSSNVAKVSLTYKETTVYRELSSDALHNLDYKNPTINERGDEFTHVVLGIQYGVTCTMVFEREIKDSETKEEIEGALAEILESLPKKATLKLKSNEKEKIGNFKCTVYSDLESNASVKTWYEALSLCESLPTKLSTSGETYAKIGVPVKIWLLPKQLLLSQHNNLVKELPTDVVNKPKEMVESLTEAVNELRDLLVKTKMFPILNGKISRFTELVENYTITFRKDILSGLLVSIRNGTDDKKVLSDAVEKHERSPFGYFYMGTWIGRTKWEVDTLLAIQNQLPDKCVSFPNETFEQNILKEKINVVFTLKICKKEDAFIDKMGNYYHHLTQRETTTSGKENLHTTNKKKWFEDESLKEKMRVMAKQMRIFASANQKNEVLGFFMREIEFEKTPGCCIEVYEKGGKLSCISFEPPTEIRNLQIKEYSHSTMEIEWNVPEEGRFNISNYKIEVTDIMIADKKKSSELLSQIKIPRVESETMTHVITNLRAGRQYQVLIQCLCLNDNAFSKPVTLLQMTRLSNPPVQFRGEVKKKRHVKLAWEFPTIKAEYAKLKGFLIEYKATNEKSLFSKSIPSDVKSYIFSDLCYCTKYQFRILAYYISEEGYDGVKETLPSEGINLKTEAMNVPKVGEVYKYFHLHYFQKY